MHIFIFIYIYMYVYAHTHAHTMLDEFCYLFSLALDHRPSPHLPVSSEAQNKVSLHPCEGRFMQLAVERVEPLQVSAPHCCEVGHKAFISS